MRNKRPDAATRRSQLLDAADAVFSAHSVHAPLELIVEKAGVGRATLYRQFPDREAILLALMERMVERLHEKARSVQDHDDAFFVLLQYLANRIVESPVLSDYWRTVGLRDPRFMPARQRAWEAFAPALTRAKAAGLLREDVQPSDLSLLSGMLGAALRGADAAQRRQYAQRALDLLTLGLRPRLPADEDGAQP